MKLLLISLVLLLCTGCSVAQKNVSATNRPEVTYQVTELVDTRLPTIGTSRPVFRKAVTVTFSENLFGDPDVPRQPVRGLDYDELCVKLIVAAEPILEEGSRVNLLNNQMIFIPTDPSQPIDKPIRWLLRKIEILYRVKLVQQTVAYNTRPAAPQSGLLISLQNCHAILY